MDQHTPNAYGNAFMRNITPAGPDPSGAEDLLNTIASRTIDSLRAHRDFTTDTLTELLPILTGNGSRLNERLDEFLRRPRPGP